MNEAGDIHPDKTHVRVSLKMQALLLAGAGGLMWTARGFYDDVLHSRKLETVHADMLTKADLATVEKKLRKELNLELSKEDQMKCPAFVVRGASTVKCTILARLEVEP